ncbi:MAG: hypothetical protein ACRBBP_03645 [Bdellovibrionales bacterium]
MKSIFVSIILLTFSSWSFAGEYSCPETHPEYNKVLKELQDFQKKLKEELKCQEIAVNFDKLTGLIGADKRGEILSLVSSNEGQALSADNAKKIQEYAGSVTEEVGVLVSLIGAAANGELSWWETLTGTDRCSMDEEDQLDGIEQLTKAAYEATNLISKVAGPYGVPLQVGVSTIYGVVQGLQNYSERARNIDFDPFEKRQFFESAVCIMSKFDSDIRKLNNPEAHLRNLRIARSQASRVVNVVRDQCQDCGGVIDASTEEEAKAAFHSMTGATALLGEKAYEGRANLEWIDGEIQKFNEIANFKTGGIGPRELQSLKLSINKFILTTAAPDFLKWYGNKASISNRQLGRKIGSAMSEMRSEIREAGKYFDVSLPQTIEDEFAPQHDSIGRVISYSIASENIKNAYVMQAAEISSLFFMINNSDKLDSYSTAYYSLLGEAYDVWKLSDFNVRVVQEYCSFFEETLQYNNSVQNACEANKVVWHSLRTGYQSFYLASLINPESIMDRLGPFDFRLESHYKYILRFKNSSRSGVLRIAEEGLDFESVLDMDRSVRQKDGRWRPFNEDFDDPAWWEDVEGNAEDFLQGFYNLQLK